MRDEHAGFALRDLSYGGVKLGAATALIDEDVLRILLLDAPTADRSLQLRYSAIARVVSGPPTGVTIEMKDGRRLVTTTDEPDALRSSVLAACRALPEVTRALRALGSRRRVAGTARLTGEREARFFLPFIAARRAAMDARSASGVIASFDPRHLGRDLDRLIEELASERGGDHPARRRAAEAELSDAADPLREALEGLVALSSTASADVDDLAAWRAWASGVQRLFEIADRTWVEIDAVMER